ncbi:hypothetical protein ASD54_08655 [Rhizobium sp. Root149]|uniref:hypothetical protein n=1 Tax=Rhizobium sp. Root149 TaxID=1736473 RepID=UPI000713649A|nr:hypothetical protein [Rhizobium sp. Root149]KQZ50315.1 hypothetical protein ASD54_08655 [Rhizobium sp. Root149]
MKNTLAKNQIAALEDRISVVNAEFGFDPAAHIAFDIAVDGQVVHTTLEWIDEDMDLSHQDTHLAANGEYRHSVASALSSSDKEHYEQASQDAQRGMLGDISEIVHQKLLDAHEELKDRVAEAA